MDLDVHRVHRSVRMLVQDRVPRHVKLNVLPCVLVHAVESVELVVEVAGVVEVAQTPVQLAVRQHVPIAPANAKANVEELVKAHVQEVVQTLVKAHVQTHVR